MKNENIYEILGRCFLFEGLEKDEIIKLTDISGYSVRSYEGGEIIAGEGADGELGIILEGCAEAVPNGAKGALLRRLNPSDAFGVAVLFGSSEGYVSTVRAKKKTSVLFIPRRGVSDIIKANPLCAENYITFLSDRIRFLNSRIATFTSESAEKKLFGYIKKNADEEGCFTVPASLSSLAKLLNTGRASLYRILDGLEKEGKIVRDGKIIKIIK